MNRRALVLMPLGLLLAACDTGGVSGGYMIRPSQAGRIQDRFLEEVNLRRRAQGLAPVRFNAELKTAADAHSRDMSAQNRPWHWGSDASSPVDRVARAGYPGRFVGENISESFEDELITLDAWMSDPNTRAVIMDPEAQDMALGWYQDAANKIWWTLVTGESGQLVAAF